MASLQSTCLAVNPADLPPALIPTKSPPLGVASMDFSPESVKARHTAELRARRQPFKAGVVEALRDLRDGRNIVWCIDLQPRVWETDNPDEGQVDLHDCHNCSSCLARQHYDRERTAIEVIRRDEFRYHVEIPLADRNAVRTRVRNRHGSSFYVSTDGNTVTFFSTVSSRKLRGGPSAEDYGEIEAEPEDLVYLLEAAIEKCDIVGTVCTAKSCRVRAGAWEDKADESSYDPNGGNTVSKDQPPIGTQAASGSEPSEPVTSSATPAGVASMNPEDMTAPPKRLSHAERELISRVHDEHPTPGDGPDVDVLVERLKRRIGRYIPWCGKDTRGGRADWREVIEHLPGGKLVPVGGAEGRMFNYSFDKGVGKIFFAIACGKAKYVDANFYTEHGTYPEPEARLPGTERKPRHVSPPTPAESLMRIKDPSPTPKAVAAPPKVYDAGIPPIIRHRWLGDGHHGWTCVSNAPSMRPSTHDPECYGCGAAIAYNAVKTDGLTDLVNRPPRAADLALKLDLKVEAMKQDARWQNSSVGRA